MHEFDDRFYKSNHLLSRLLKLKMKARNVVTYEVFFLRFCLPESGYVNVNNI
jgi:hypothetical protein